MIPENEDQRDYSGSSLMSLRWSSTDSLPCHELIWGVNATDTERAFLIGSSISPMPKPTARIDLPSCWRYIDRWSFFFPMSRGSPATFTWDETRTGTGLPGPC